MVTGNYLGRARTVEELRADLDFAYSLIPGPHRLNLHAIYGEFGGARVDRDQIELAHFQGWINWAKAHNLKLDFNATCFSHPNAAAGFTLSSKDENIRRLLDRARQALPRDRRGDGGATRRAGDAQPLDSRRREGIAGGGGRLPRAPAGLPR